MAKFIFLYQVVAENVKPFFSVDEIEATGFAEAINKWEGVLVGLHADHATGKASGEIPVNVPAPTFHLVQISIRA